MMDTIKAVAVLGAILAFFGLGYLMGAPSSAGNFGLYTGADAVYSECHYWPGTYQGDKTGTIIICKTANNVYTQYFVLNKQ